MLILEQGESPSMTGLQMPTHLDREETESASRSSREDVTRGVPGHGLRHRIRDSVTPLQGVLEIDAVRRQISRE